jgi:hypothetical protein
VATTLHSDPQQIVRFIPGQGYPKLQLDVNLKIQIGDAN